METKCQKRENTKKNKNLLLGSRNFLQDYRYCLSEKKKEEVKNNFLENINEFLLEKEPDKKKKQKKK